jgi:molybdopterin molybdotransferase
MVTVSEALTAILERAKALAPREIDLAALPLGQVLAEAKASDIDSPPYTKALMDGYAVRADDCVSVPVTLRMIEEIAAGKLPLKTVNPGEASRIMTGAAMPAGADTVVMIEKTEAVSATEVRIMAAVARNQNVMERGAEMKSGEIVLKPGAVLNPQELGLLAAMGFTAASVYPKPRVAVLSTGDEIVEAGRKPGPGQIRNSNGPMLLAQTLRAGGTPNYLGVARDTRESLRSLIGKGLNDSDVLILSGGVSAGKFDLVPGVLEELGVVAHFHKVVMKPGKPLFFGTPGATLVFGLPGNPVSSFVCFELFIRPALRALSGHADPGPAVTELPIAVDFRSQNDRPTYWPARIEPDGHGRRVRALPWSGSADLRSLHTANALLALPAGLNEFGAGQLAPVIVVES